MEKEKICNKCEKSKSLSDFYAHKNFNDGLFPYCKTCHDIKSLKYQKSEVYKKYKRKYTTEYRNRAEERDKYLCRKETRRLRNIGVIKIEICCVCGNEKTEAHHLDYTNPMEIMWLCKKHHCELHRQLKTLN